MKRTDYKHDDDESAFVTGEYRDLMNNATLVINDPLNPGFIYLNVLLTQEDANRLRSNVKGVTISITRENDND